MSFSVKLVAAMTISLFLSSVLISFFAIQMFGNNMGVEYAAVPLDINGILNYNNQDIAGGNFNTSNFNIYPTNSWIYVAGQGYVCQGGDLLGDAMITPKGLEVDSAGKITNSYTIQNPSQAEYSIILNYDANDAPSQNIIQVKSDGFHVYKAGSLLFPKPELFISAPGASLATLAQIKTVYNRNTNSATINFNGQSYTLNDLNPELKPTSILNALFGGIRTSDSSLTLSQYSSPNPAASSQVKQSVTDAFSNLLALLTVMAQTLTFGLPESVMPIFLQLILIRTQEVLLAIGIFGMARGV
jgi:hypothetical protein